MGSNWAQKNNTSTGMMMDSQLNISNSLDQDAEESPVEIEKMEYPALVITKEVHSFSQERSPSNNSKKFN